MRLHSTVRLSPRSFLLLILASVSCLLMWDSPRVRALGEPTIDPNAGLFLVGLEAPGTVLAASAQTNPAKLSDPHLSSSDDPTADTPVWEEFPPAVRFGHTAVFDPDGERMIVFGGLDGENLSNKTWVFTEKPAPKWEMLPSLLPDPIDYTPADSVRRPSPRAGQAVVFVPDQSLLLLIGGIGLTGPRRDVWALDLAAGSDEWTRLIDESEIPDQVLPAPRSGHTAIYEPVGRRVIVFGGTAGNLDFLEDTWVLDLAVAPARWSILELDSPAAPSARVGHTAVYDPIGNRMLVFGGLDEQLELLDDTWELSLSGEPAGWKWKHIQPSGNDQLPSARVRHVAVFEAKHNRMLVFAGVNKSSEQNDLWELSFERSTSWRLIRAAGDTPGRRLAAAAVMDAVNDRMLIFGGLRRGFDLNDTWSLSLVGKGTPKWTRVSSPAGDPGARLGHAAVYDRSRDRMLVVGGEQGAERLSDVWALNMSENGEKRRELKATGPVSSAGANERISWRQLRIRGESPQGRVGHTIVHDPEEDRLIVFGGLSNSYLDDLWALSLGGPPGQQRWERLWPDPDPDDGAPRGRSDHTAVYDSRRKRMLVFGGISGSRRTNDVWALTLGEEMAWGILKVGTEPAPAGRSGHVAVYDSLYDRMVVWGGVASDPGSPDPPDAWELSFGEGDESSDLEAATARWKRIVTQGSAPGWLFGASAVYDPHERRMLLTGGGHQQGHQFRFDRVVYELTLQDAPTWNVIETSGNRPKSRSLHSAVYDSRRDRVVIYGGGRVFGAWLYGADLWTLNLDSARQPTPYIEQVPSEGPDVGKGRRALGTIDLVLALAPPKPNPARDETVVSFSLPGREPARLEIVDVRGRRVARRDLQAFGPGNHTVQIAAGGLRAGVYFLKLSYGQRTLTEKWAVVK